LVARRQAEAREEQRRLNAELRATRALLAESSRINERMRISRELHDLLGHHLTALSLNLEVASHMSQGRVQEHVRQAQSLAKLLLADVREAVSQLREDDAIDLTEALRSVVDGVPGLDVQLDIPEQFHVDQPERAHLLLRLAQEAITNAVRHAEARTLSLSVAEDGDDLLMTARDDGRGADQFRPGNGLNGMRERLEQIGGQLDIETARGAGFCVRMRIPGRGLDLSPPREINLAGKARAAASASNDVQTPTADDEVAVGLTNKETTT
ncbi:MAG: sensor histidine kinase, partial [Xanthomonadales bacterium]|nr:sensor histidine kinase [Xanthomonadales bacterium]